MEKQTSLEIIYGASDAVRSRKTRSAWDRGVNEYAIELLEKLTDNVNYLIRKDNCPEFINSDNKPIERNDLEKILLSGAQGWYEFSWGGRSLVCDLQIAERLCTPSELKKTKGGEKRPNPKEEWLDVQTRALKQAAHLVIESIHAIASAKIENNKI